MAITTKDIKLIERKCKENPRTDMLIQGYIIQAMEMTNEEGKKEGDKDVVLFLLKAFKPDIVGKEMYDWRFMYEASERGWTDVVKELIQLGLKSTPGLLPAVSEGHKDIVEILLDNGADLRDPNCGNVIGVAKSCGYSEISEILEKVWKETCKE